jgi:methylase of polypeptide subunit release factors
MAEHLVARGDLTCEGLQLGKPFGNASPADKTLAILLKELRRRNYQFVTPTPATHALVVGRNEPREAHSLTDVLGWSLPFREGLLDGELLALLREAGALGRQADGLWQSTVRVSSLHRHLFLHSAYPCDARDAVFFGPDSYRFADAIVAELKEGPAGNEPYITDIGTGCGVGAIVAAGACPDAVITMTDINPEAIRYARVNAAVAGVPIRALVSPDLSRIRGQIDLILANPPYMVDPARRTYRDGGGMHGGAVALAMTEMALDRLAARGRLLLYTGSAIVSGQDLLRESLQQLGKAKNCAMRYREIDPDVFGEELNNPYYSDVDRIAVVTAVFTAGP